VNDAATILARSRTDLHLQAYLLKRLCRESPRTVLENAGEFVQVLAGFEPDQVDAILDVLSAQRGTELTRFLLLLLAQDQRWPVQVKTIMRLATLANEPRVLPAFVQLLGTAAHPRVKACILSALGRSKIDIPMKVLKPYLTHADNRIRASALELLLSRDLSQASDVLFLFLNDSSPRVKAAAAVGLWRMGNSVLLELLNDAEELEHRVAYVYALGQTGRDAQTRRLLVRSLKSPHQAERLMACRSLASVAEPDDIPDLLDVALDLPGKDTRESLIRSCGTLDHRRTVSVIQAMLESSEKNRQPRRVATLLSMLASFDGGGIGRNRGRPLAARASLPEADLEFLGHLLESPDGRVRANTVEVLSPFYEVARVHQMLVPCTSSDIARVRANAALPLWKSGFQSAMCGLKEMLVSSQSTVRASACWALGQIGGFIATSYLKKSLDDPDESVRRLAFSGLHGDY